MIQSSEPRIARLGRVFPEYSLSLEEIAKRKAEREFRYQRCLPVFERIRSEFIGDRYNWYMLIEPNSGDYFIDASLEIAEQKARQKYPEDWLITFRLNETGACGKI